MGKRVILENLNLQEIISAGQAQGSAHFVATPKMSYSEDTRDCPENPEVHNNNPLTPPHYSSHCGCRAGVSSLICMPRNIMSASSTLSTVTSILEQPATSATFNNCNFYCADIFNGQCKKRRMSSVNFNSETDSNLSIESALGNNPARSDSISDQCQIFGSQPFFDSIGNFNKPINFLPPPKEFAESDVDNLMKCNVTKSNSVLTDVTPILSITDDFEPDYPSERFDYYSPKNFWETPTAFKVSAYDCLIPASEEQHGGLAQISQRSLPHSSQSSPEIRWIRKNESIKTSASISSSKLLCSERADTSQCLRDPNDVILAVSIVSPTNSKLQENCMEELQEKRRPDLEVENSHRNYLVLPVYCCSNQAALQKISTRKCEISGYGRAFKKIKDAGCCNANGNDCTSAKSTARKNTRRRKSRIAFIPIFRRKTWEERRNVNPACPAEACQKLLQVTPLYTQVSARVPYRPNSCRCGNVPSDAVLSACKSRLYCKPQNEPCCRSSQPSCDGGQPCCVQPNPSPCPEPANQCSPLPDPCCQPMGPCCYQSADPSCQRKDPCHIPVEACCPPGDDCCKPLDPCQLMLQTLSQNNCSAVQSPCGPLIPKPNIQYSAKSKGSILTLQEASQYIKSCCRRKSKLPIKISRQDRNNNCAKSCLRCVSKPGLGVPQCKRPPPCRPPPPTCKQNYNPSTTYFTISQQPGSCTPVCIKEGSMPAPNQSPAGYQHDKQNPSCVSRQRQGCPQERCSPSTAQISTTAFNRSPSAMQTYVPQRPPRPPLPCCPQPCVTASARPQPNSLPRGILNRRPSCKPICQPACRPSALICAPTCGAIFQPDCVPKCELTYVPPRALPPTGAPTSVPTCQLSCPPKCAPQCQLPCQPTCTPACQIPCIATYKPIRATTCQPSVRTYQPSCQPLCAQTFPLRGPPASSLTLQPTQATTYQLTSPYPNAPAYPALASGQITCQAQCPPPYSTSALPTLTCTPICPPTIECRKRKIKCPPPRPPPPVFYNRAKEFSPSQVTFEPRKQKLNHRQDFPIVPSRSNSPETGTLPPPTGFSEVDIRSLKPLTPPPFRQPKFLIAAELQTFNVEVTSVPQAGFPELPRSKPLKMDPQEDVDFNFTIPDLDLNMNSLSEPRKSSWEAALTRFPSKDTVIPPVVVPQVGTPPRFASLKLDALKHENSFEPTDVQMKLPSVDFTQLANIYHELAPPTSPLTGTGASPPLSFDIPTQSIPDLKPMRVSSRSEPPPSNMNSQFHPPQHIKKGQSGSPSPRKVSSPSFQFPSSPRSSVVSCSCSPCLSSCKVETVCCPKLPPRRPRKLLSRRCSRMISSLQTDYQNSPLLPKCSPATYHVEETVRCCPPYPLPTITTQNCSNISAADVIPVLAQVLADMMVVPKAAGAGELLGGVMTPNSLTPAQIFSGQQCQHQSSYENNSQLHSSAFTSTNNNYCQQPQSFSFTVAPRKNHCKRRVTGCRKY